MDLENLCRLCGSEQKRMHSIFEGFPDEKLVSIIAEVLRLDIHVGDGFPQNACQTCVTKLMRIRDNLEEFRANERALRERIVAERERSQHKRDKLRCCITNKNSCEHQLDKLEDPCREKEIKLGSQTPKPVLNEEDTREPERTYSTDDERSNATFESDSCKQRTISAVQKELAIDRPRLNDHKCYICRGAPQSSAKALLEHIGEHVDIIPYSCKECVMETVVLKNVRSLNVHCRMHAQPVKCEYCDRRYCNKKACDLHVKTFHLGESAPCPSTCPQCSVECKSATALKQHLRNHRINLQCVKCSKVFHKRTNLKEHVLRVHEKSDQMECNICGKMLHSLNNYNTHLLMHRKEKTFQCDLCPMSFYTSGNLNLHKKVHVNNPNYKPYKDWTQHYTVSKPDPSQPTKRYSCKICDKFFDGGVHHINRHLNSHFKEIQCDQCGLRFETRSKLQAHSVVHTQIRKFKCEYCAKDFLHKSNLNHHRKTTHKDRLPSCTHCSMTFLDENALGKHASSVHKAA